MIYKGQGELPHHLKNIEYFSIGKPRREMRLTEMPDEVKEIACEFESAWHHLKNGMALVYDGVYTEEELDFAGMRQRVKDLHEQLKSHGYEKTDVVGE